MVRADVALTGLDGDAKAVVGSFTVDGLTYAIDGEGQAALVAVAPLEGGEGKAEADASSAAFGEGAEDSGAEGARAEADGATLTLPAAVSYGGTDYSLMRIAPLALDGCGAAALSIPASVETVDTAAALGCDTLAEVTVAEDNPAFSVLDGYLADKAQTSILLVPEGRVGQLRIPQSVQAVDPRVFSHCTRVTGLVVDAGCPGLASWNGSLYTKDLTELLRVPAGAAELTLSPECTAIGPSALSGCTALRSIEALGVVSSIAPSAFGEIEEVEALPAAAVSPADEAAAPGHPAQVTGLVAVASNALSSVQVDKGAISVVVPEGSDASAWKVAGFAIGLASTNSTLDSGQAELQGRASYVTNVTVHLNANGGAFTVTRCRNFSIVDGVEYGDWETVAGSAPEWNAVYDSDGATQFGCDAAFGAGWWIWEDGVEVLYRSTCLGRVGYTLTGIGGSVNLKVPVYAQSFSAGSTYTLLWRPNAYTISLDGQGGTVSQASIAATYDQDTTLPEATRAGYKFLGWNTAVDGSGVACQPGTVRNLTTEDGATVAFYAQWERVDFDLGFDTDSEPGDVDYPGVAKSDETINKDSGAVPIEDPKRPGYVFEGWVIPSTDGTEAGDQDLVYQGDDGKWYVDASKLPDYADGNGKVELTARWTSVISVDVPSSVTFYADLVTQGQESREGAASGGGADGAFGQSKAVNQSQVDLRVMGLESSAVKTDGSTLGADSVLKKASAATPSTSTQKLLSLYPSTKQWTAEELQDPDAVGGEKPASVDFDLDDILLEKSFTSGDLPADAFNIPAGGTLNMGYRLNLAETGQQLDYDKLSTLSEGQSAAIANVSYCFSADPLPSDWGEPLWVENPDRASNPAKYLLLDDIKEAADDLSANGTSSEYYALYKVLLEDGADFQLRVDGAYSPVQLIGICQDAKAIGGGVAGLTFSFKDPWRLGAMNATDTGTGGWEASQVRALLRGDGTYAGAGFADKVDKRLRTLVVTVSKRQQLQPADGKGLQATSDTFFIPSCYEVFGTNSNGVWNGDESPSNCFQYQWFAQWGANYDAVPERVKGYDGSPVYWWTRSACSANNRGFGGVSATGSYAFMGATPEIGIIPCFCL